MQYVGQKATFLNYFTSLGYLYYRSELQNLKEAWYQEIKCCYKHFHHIVILEICKSLHLKTKGCIRENKLFKQETSEELDKRWNCNSNKKRGRLQRNYTEWIILLKNVKVTLEIYIHQLFKGNKWQILILKSSLIVENKAMFGNVTTHH